ncbi:MAG: peptide-methionine (S)-S-oxide reductase MsrA [Bacilli bacterium]
MEKRIVIGGGCFWGVEEYFKRLKGVTKTTVGYANGNMENPTYQDLISHKANHVEACELYYDDSIISLKTILSHMFRFIDPFSINKQGGDIGVQYRTGVYYQDDEDKTIAEDFMNEMSKKYNRKVAVEVQKEKHYYLAEEYHQDYLQKNPTGYCHVNMNLIKEDEKK